MKLPPQVFAGDRPEPQKLMPVRNSNSLVWKPEGGLWTSTYLPDGDHVSEWVQWTVSEQFKQASEVWLLTPTEARVAVVRDQTDLSALVASYKREPPWAGAESLSSMQVLLGYEALAQDFDVLWLPEPWEHRFNGDLALSMFFSVMDAESSIWFRWCFDGEPERLYGDRDTSQNTELYIPPEER